MIIAWLNFILFNVFGIVCWYFYILSVMPATRAEKVGDQAWNDCKRFRAIAGVFGIAHIINIILWIFFPLPGLALPVHPNYLVPFLIGVAIAIPGTTIMIIGVKDAGRETMAPSEDTMMYGGIYQHIRHPQVLGEMPWYIVVALWLNSLFLVIYVLILIIILIPTMIYFEEKDLEKRFGDAYREYKQRTGALIPKFWKRKRVK